MTDSKPWEAPPADVDPRVPVLMLSLMTHFQEVQGWDAMPMIFLLDHDFDVMDVVVLTGGHPIDMLRSAREVLEQRLAASAGAIVFVEAWTKDPKTLERNGDEERTFHFVTRDRATLGVAVRRSDIEHPRWSTGATMIGPMLEAIEGLYI